MTNDSYWNNHDIYCYRKGQHTGHTDPARYRYFLSNLLFNIYYAHFFKSVNDSWWILKLYALHIHRARAPT